MVPTSESPWGPGGAGLRAFRYALPTTPIATAAVDIGHVGVQFELFLAGDLAITHAPYSDDIEDGDVRACTLKALRAMAKGLMISGVGSYSPTISSTARHMFSQVGYRFQAPNTMTFAGDCTIEFAQPGESGTVSVAGDLRYSLDVTAMPADGRLTAPPDQARAWFLRHEQELASIGMVVLVAVPIAPGQLVEGDAA
jgi:hypothetical protein